MGTLVDRSFSPWRFISSCSHLLDIRVFPHQRWRQECSRGSALGSSYSPDPSICRFATIDYWTLMKFRGSMLGIDLCTRPFLSHFSPHSLSGNQTSQVLFQVWKCCKRPLYVSGKITTTPRLVSEYLPQTENKHQIMNIHTKWDCLMPILSNMVNFYLFQVWKCSSGLHETTNLLDQIWQNGYPTVLFSVYNHNLLFVFLLG